jgi:hypothetical protein
MPRARSARDTLAPLEAVLVVEGVPLGVREGVGVAESVATPLAVTVRVPRASVALGGTGSIQVGVAVAVPEAVAVAEAVAAALLVAVAEAVAALLPLAVAVAVLVLVAVAEPAAEAVLLALRREEALGEAPALGGAEGEEVEEGEPLLL